MARHMVSVLLEDELYKKVEEEGKKTDRSIGAMLRIALRYYFTKVDKDEN